MRFTLTARAVVAAAMGAIAIIAPTDAGAVDSNRTSDLTVERGLASFEGRTIELQNGWVDAEACHVAEDFTISCYRSERAMDEAHGLNARTGGDYPSAANGYASCGSSLRLYWNTYYSYPVLYLTTRGSWTNLGWFGYDNKTSSYKVGSCQSLFRSGNYGGGSTYPGPTYAWAKRSTMGWGWDNVLSSVYMY